MRDYIITTDSACDMPKEFIQENNIKEIPLYYQLGDEVYGGDKEMDVYEFYARMRNGDMPTTMGCNPEVTKEYFRQILERGMDILHIAFSSGLSVSYNSAKIAQEDLKEEFPKRKIIVIDTVAASMGEGLIVYKAAQLKDKGKSMDEVAQWVRENLQHVCHRFTVTDLFHLHRGGRVSKTVAIVGTLAHVKPIMHVDDEGLLKPLVNVRGRRKSIDTLVKDMIDTIDENDKEIAMISHGDCLEDAEQLAKLVKEKTGIKEVMINILSPTIGSHAGPGTLALFYMGTQK